jgi:hypothetical protein
LVRPAAASRATWAPIPAGDDLRVRIAAAVPGAVSGLTRS